MKYSSLRNWIPASAVFPMIGLIMLATAVGQQGPFDPESWPPTTDSTKEVHYVVLDSESSFAPVGNRWFEGDLSVLTGGDQVTRPTTIGGHQGVKTIGTYLNVADNFYFDWADDPVIDILVQFFGDAGVLTPTGEPRDYTFLLGTLPAGPDGNLSFVSGGALPLEAKNGKWNWALFRVENGIRPDGGRYVDMPALNAQGASGNGGVNGGTIRFQNVPGFTVRVVAFGEEGAFGEPDQINQFLPPDFCEPEPETNRVFVDVANDTSDHLRILDDGDQTVSFQSGIGPANDRRRAVIADGLYMNFGIEDEYLGKPCNDPVSIKICVEYYDDPLLLGASFGPEAYATDDQGGIEVLPTDNYHFPAGTGEWVKAAFVVPAVNLSGVNTGAFTGGPRLLFEVASVYLSRIDIGVFRTGEHVLAGQDPIPDCFEDPFICTDAYSNYAELDFQNDVRLGLTPGNSAGDQNMIEAEAGPPGDRRLAIRPAFDDGTPNFNHNYLNFSVIDEVFGPNSQPNAQLAICVTYYDDASLTGETFRPEVFQVDRGGQVTFGFTSPDIAVELEGTDTWRDAYFEIPQIKFNGVNQGPQAAARFILSDKIFFSRIRYGVIRPCGDQAGVNPLEECKPKVLAPALSIGATVAGDGGVTLSWPAEAFEFRLQMTRSLSNPDWIDVVELPVAVEAAINVDLALDKEAYFRLIR